MDWIENSTILRGLVGSNVHGLALEGKDDRDEMGVCLEPAQYVIGLEHFEQYIFRTAEQRQHPSNQSPPSQPGDLDLVIYSLRKWTRLAVKGNPTVLLLLFVPTDCLVACTKLGQELRDMSWAFATRSAAAPFLGYLTAQKQRILGERGQLRVTRQELVDTHGFDTKYAGHMLRLGHQGIEFLQTGKITLPMPDTVRQYILRVRRGEIPLNEVLTEVGLLEEQLRDLAITSPLPEHPDYAAVNDFLIRAYQTHWQ